MLKSVGIMISTYNGKEWIVEQLDSLVAQENVEISLFIRDDGSTDETVSIVEGYRGKFRTLTIFQESNIGATLSFYRLAELVLKSGIACDYYAFCDQDDIWLKDKISTAVKWLETQDNSKPNLYFSNLMMVDSEGKEQLGKLINPKAISTSKGNAFAAIGTYGCTCVFNPVALNRFCRIADEKKHIYHDNWLYGLTVMTGNVFYDDVPHILYRQTGNNQSGEKRKGLSLWLQRIGKLRDMRNGNHIYEDIAFEVLRLFKDELREDDRTYLEDLCNYRNNAGIYFKMLISKRMRTECFSKNVCIVGRTILRGL